MEQGSLEGNDTEHLGWEKGVGESSGMLGGEVGTGAVRRDLTFSTKLLGVLSLALLSPPRSPLRVTMLEAPHERQHIWLAFLGCMWPFLLGRPYAVGNGELLRDLMCSRCSDIHVL